PTLVHPRPPELAPIHDPLLPPTLVRRRSSVARASRLLLNLLDPRCPDCTAHVRLRAMPPFAELRDRRLTATMTGLLRRSRSQSPVPLDLGSEWVIICQTPKAILQHHAPSKHPNVRFMCLESVLLHV
uniref:Uncharacterized protein n=1 Tax=Triticum urartu TaxID=4572 RepID=A0A8R7PT13_TRIUA